MLAQPERESGSIPSVNILLDYRLGEMSRSRSGSRSGSWRPSSKPELEYALCFNGRPVDEALPIGETIARLPLESASAVEFQLIHASVIVARSGLSGSLSGSVFKSDNLRGSGSGRQPSERSAGEAEDLALLVEEYSAHLKAAEQGEADAQFNLALCFENGEGVAKNPEEAVVWYGKAAEQEHARAQHNLAGCFMMGEGVARDVAQAAIWLRRAAEEGHAAAQSNLAGCLLTGAGVTLDAEQAVVWFRKAGEQGDADAQCYLALCLDLGEGVARDAEQAAVWYRKAVEQGHARAQHHLGVLLLRGAPGVPQDAKAGARFLGAAAQQGFAAQSTAVSLQLLELHAGTREVAEACCLGCGATVALKSCAKCLVARFCSKACVARMWPVHKPHCKLWQAEAKAETAHGGA